MHSIKDRAKKETQNMTVVSNIKNDSEYRAS